MNPQCLKSIIIMVILLLLTQALPQLSARQTSIHQKDGDLIIAGIFPVHREPKQGDTLPDLRTKTCGAIWEEYGIQRVEQFIKSIEEVNANPHILPGIKLGYMLMDSCWNTQMALQKIIMLIQRILQNDHSKRIISLIGPANSDVFIAVQNVMQYFSIPSIGYSSTVPSLSNKNNYRFSFRVVPSDTFQAKLLVDIVRHFNWNYVSLVHSNNQYGQQGIEQVRGYLNEHKICTDQNQAIDPNARTEKFTDLVKTLFVREQNVARVVICFCYGEVIGQLFAAMQRQNLTSRGFLILGSDGWSNRKDVLGAKLDDPVERDKYEYSNIVQGSISIRLQSPIVTDFETHFKSLTYNRTTNPWWREFWEQKFKCSFERRTCNGRQSLDDMPFNMDNKLGFVQNSVHTLVTALKSYQIDECGPNPDSFCEKMRNFNSTKMREYIQRVNVSDYAGNTISFDDKGDPIPRYDILNYQLADDPHTAGKKLYKYEQVGSMVNMTLTLDESKIEWPFVSHDIKTAGPNTTQVRRDFIYRSWLEKRIFSNCSLECPSGRIRVVSSACCWTCKECETNQYVLNVNTCKNCTTGFKPNANFTGCEKIEVEFLRWTNTLAILSIVLCTIGLICTLFVLAVMIKFYHTAVVKASTRELMFIILSGMLVGHCTSFVAVSEPTRLTCALSFIMPGLSLSLMFGALVTKTNRIARILARSKKKFVTGRARYLTTSAQIVITVLINLVEFAVVATTILLDFNKPRSDLFGVNRMRKVCDVSLRNMGIALGFDALLVCLCTMYAIRTRNLPQNFNETKFIGFTMYTTCVIWLALAIIYSQAASQRSAVFLAIAVSLTATITLVLIFGPKIYIILLQPEKNTRSAFTTCTDIRLHIGGIDATVTKNRNHGGQALPVMVSASSQTVDSDLEQTWPFCRSALAEYTGKIIPFSKLRKRQRFSCLNMGRRMRRRLVRKEKERARSAEPRICLSEKKQASDVKTVTGVQTDLSWTRAEWPGYYVPDTSVTTFIDVVTETNNSTEIFQKRGSSFDLQCASSRSTCESPMAVVSRETLRPPTLAMDEERICSLAPTNPPIHAKDKWKKSRKYVISEFAV